MLNTSTITETAGALGLFGLGYWEVVIILVVVLLLFGAKKLPELARGLGRALHVFGQEVKGIRKDIEEIGEGEEEGDSRDAPPTEDSSEKDKDV